MHFWAKLPPTSWNLLLPFVMCHFSSLFYRYVMSSWSGSDSPSSCQFGRYHSIKLLLSPARWKPLCHQVVQRPRRISDLCSWTQPSFKNIPPQRNPPGSKLFSLSHFEANACGGKIFANDNTQPCRVFRNHNFFTAFSSCNSSEMKMQ